MCENLFGEGIGGDRGKAFSIEVLEFMRDVLVGFQEDTGQL